MPATVVLHSAAGGFTLGLRPDRPAATPGGGRCQRGGRVLRLGAAGSFTWGPRPDRPAAAREGGHPIPMMRTTPPATTIFACFIYYLLMFLSVSRRFVKGGNVLLLRF